MEKGRVAKIAAAWLLAQESLWAHHELGRLIEKDPLSAWRVIESIISRTEDQETLKMIGVGPIEDLQSDRGEEVIAEVEHYAKAEPKLLISLAAAWKSTATDEVWGRVQKLLRKAGHAA